VERRLAAVLAADVAGYSRLMGADEEGTLARLKAVRKALVDPTIAAHRGRIVKTTGDGMLIEFASAVDAARSAVEVQRDMAAQNADISPDIRIEFRIGIHVGDIIIDENDIFGDGVNIAARLEGIAEPGGVCISDDAQRQVRGKVDFACEDLGLQTLKNIAEPMRAWRVQLQSVAKAQPGSLAGQAPALALPDKPSIAVLPFQNMSGDPEQEYFADGMVEDIITALSRFKSLFVIARNSSFTYKGKAVDIKQVGRELGVRYVLEGSVRKAGTRVRITGQLIDAATGAHLWADRFESQLDDIFDLQDRVTMSVVGAIAPEPERAEIERAQRKPTESLQAYDYYLRGLASYHRFTREANLETLKLARIASTIDPEFALSYALGALTWNQRKNFGWIIDFAQEAADARRLAKRAVDLDKGDSTVLAMAGNVLNNAGEVEEGTALIERAIDRNPNYASARYWMGFGHLYLGNVEDGLREFQLALRLSPLDPHIYGAHGMAFANFLAGRNAEALTWATTAVRQHPNHVPTQRGVVACLAVSGRIEEAREACTRLLQLDPTQRISRTPPYRRQEDIKRLAEAFRIAGLPE
jgi:TolB-like protein/class 3 adenylate cyclase/Tfp pilus assembly protein PilF